MYTWVSYWLLYQCLPGQQLVCSSGKEWPQLTNPVKTWSRALHPTSPLWRRAYQPTRRLPWWRTPWKWLEGPMEEFDKLKCEGSHIIEANENMATFLTLKYCFIDGAYNLLALNVMITLKLNCVMFGDWIYIITFQYRSKRQDCEFFANTLHQFISS